MNTSIAVKLSPAVVLRHCLLALLLAAAGVSAIPVRAAVAPSPVVSVSVTDGLGYETFSIPAQPSELPYWFEAGIDNPGLPSGGDIYFGIMRADGSAVFTWRASDASPALNKGFVPALEDLDLGTAGTIEIGRVGYTFNGSEVRGLYFAFALIASPGTDPTDASNWIAVEMRPFFVK